MNLTSRAAWLLAQEARALLTRLDRVQSFVLYETMVPAAAPSPLAMSAIETYIAGHKRRLRQMVFEYLRWLNGTATLLASPFEMQRRFTFVKLRFNLMVSHFDIFADVITQRSENATGTWISGLDSVAADALKLAGDYYEAPPVICYLDRGHGAAIRRARTRLPGGGENPAAVIRIPRERMVGSGIASSLIHEVGHQAAALLNLVPSLQFLLQHHQRQMGADVMAWRLWERWISEIIADFWSIARLGITSTMGLIGVVSLPRAFVFRVTLDDPHPMPWVRVQLSCAIGQALFPHPQWSQLSRLWGAFYPYETLPAAKRDLITRLLRSMPSFVSMLVNHRPKSLRGSSLREVMQLGERRPERLSALWRSWQGAPTQMRSAAPSLVFAVIGQARADDKISPERESMLLAELLAWWAMKDALDVSAVCADAQPVSTRARLSAAQRQLSISA